MACNQDYVKPGTKLTCQDPCRLKKADSRYSSRECLTKGKQYTCNGVSANGQTFSVQDDAGITRSFKTFGDKYFETARKATGSFGACGALCNQAFNAGLDVLTDLGGGTLPLSQFYCQTGALSSIIVDCAAGTCSSAIAGASGAAVCTNLITPSARCGSVAQSERNKCAPLCPGA